MFSMETFASVPFPNHAYMTNACTSLTHIHAPVPTDIIFLVPMSLEQGGHCISQIEHLPIQENLYRQCNYCLGEYLLNKKCTGTGEKKRTTAHTKIGIRIPQVSSNPKLGYQRKVQANQPLCAKCSMSGYSKFSRCQQHVNARFHSIQNVTLFQITIITTSAHYGLSLMPEVGRRWIRSKLPSPEQLMALCILVGHPLHHQNE